MGQGGLLVGRPGSVELTTTPTWILYESGDVVLRRSRSEEDVVAAALFHLTCLEAATESTFLPLRLRPLVLTNGRVILVDPGAMHDVAGHDRWFARHIGDVLPTTVALVDPSSWELVLPAQDFDATASSGRRPIDRILIRRPPATSLVAAQPFLALSSTVLRHVGRDLQSTLEQVWAVVTGHGVELHATRAGISDAIKGLAVRSP